MLTESEKVFIKYMNEIKSMNSYNEFLKWLSDNKQKGSKQNVDQCAI